MRLPWTEQHCAIFRGCFPNHVEQGHDACVLAGAHVEVFRNDLFKPLRGFVIHAEVGQDGRLFNKRHGLLWHVMARVLPPLKRVFPAPNRSHEDGATNPQVRSSRIMLDGKACCSDGLRRVVKGQLDLSVAWDVRVRQQGPCRCVVRFGLDQRRGQFDGTLAVSFGQCF